MTYYQDHHHHSESKNYNNNQNKETNMFEPSYHHVHTPYDYGHAAHQTINAGEEDEGPGMAGVGARRLAQRMAAQKAEQQRRWQAEQDNLLAEQERMQREYENSIRASDNNGVRHLLVLASLTM